MSSQFVVRVTPDAAHVKVEPESTLTDDGETRRLKITNEGAEAVALSSVSPWSGRLWERGGDLRLMRSGESDVLSHYAPPGTFEGSGSDTPTHWRMPGGPRQEGSLRWQALPDGLYRQEQTAGLAFDDAMFILRHRGEQEYVFVKLDWPVNWYMTVDNADAGVSFEIGPLAKDALRVIDPGETIITPAVHIARGRGDFDGVVRAMHRHVRAVVFPHPPIAQRYRIQYLLPDDRSLSLFSGEDVTETNVKTCIDDAAASGAEVFILDGPNWARGYGDWHPNTGRFPNGIAPVRDYAHALGLKFGMYAEPEGGRGDWANSDVYRQHPDWFGMRNPDFPMANFLNLARPEVAEYVEQELDSLISRERVDLYRHDQNGCFGGEGSSTIRGDFVENDYWRHYEAWNALVARLVTKYPDVIFQQASGGGSRLDFATAAVWHEHYSSDEVDFPRVFQIAAGLSVSMPPEVLVAPNGMSDKLPDLATSLRAAFALGNTPMLFNALVAGNTEQVRRYVDLFTSFMRPLLPTLEVFHIEPINGDGGYDSSEWFAMQFMAPDSSSGWATVVWLGDGPSPSTFSLRLRALDPARRYRITSDNTGQQLDAHDDLSITLTTECRSELFLIEDTSIPDARSESE